MTALLRVKCPRSVRPEPTGRQGLAAIGLILVAMPAKAYADSGFGPFGSPRHPVTRDAQFHGPAAPDRDPDTFFRLSYDVYVHVITPIDGPRCVHRPTCARYALLAVRRYGVLGLLLCVDRLLRGAESSAVRSLPMVVDAGRLVLLDSLEESAFWLPW